ncbi:MAG: GyrI-like domain-containing protein [Clostridiales bacterium]|nr:GyrI-like domain-containing protein [Clostridiales bacterium]
MTFEKVALPSFAVIGKEGSAEEGEGFVQRLWQEANGCFDEIKHLAKYESDGTLSGIWGLMTDFSRTFQPWEDGFTKGLYLAGAECRADAAAPRGWIKWTVPAFTYLKAENEPDIFQNMLAYLDQHGLALAGAVQDYTCPRTGRGYMLFPIEKNEKE